MSPTEKVRDLAEPVCAADGVELVDVELAGGVLTVTVDRDGGLDLDALAGFTRRISRLLDDDDPVPGRYTLEVSTPGLERKLRTPAHFRRAVGQSVNVRTVAGTEAGRRVRGVLVAADDDGITVGPDADTPDGPSRTVAYDQVERARTVFEWGPSPKPGAKPSAAPKPSPSSEKKAAKR